MKKIRTILAVAILVLGLGLVVPGSASAAPYCGITWGSLNKTVTSTSSAPVTGVRAGQHTCYDRMVIDVRGHGDKFTVGYATFTPLTSQGSGKPFMTWAGAALSISALVNSPAYQPANRLNLVNVAGYRTFRQISYDSSVEGHTNFGLGVRARLPFRAFLLEGRLVIDVAHQW